MQKQFENRNIMSMCHTDCYVSKNSNAKRSYFVGTNIQHIGAYVQNAQKREEFETEQHDEHDAANKNVKSRQTTVAYIRTHADTHCAPSHSAQMLFLLLLNQTHAELNTYYTLPYNAWEWAANARVRTSVRERALKNIRKTLVRTSASLY